MFKQLGAIFLCFAGILLTLWFWLQFPFFQDWLTARTMTPMDFVSGYSAWVALGGLSCLFLSHHIACWGMKVDILPLDTADEGVDKAHTLLKQEAAELGLTQLPKFGIYERSEINAMATGWSLKHGVIAVSRGALEQFETDQLRLLLRRELLSLASGDARALGVMQGMIYALSLYVARMLALLLGTSLRATEEEETSSQFIEHLVTGSLIAILAAPSALIFWAYSRSCACALDRRLSLASDGAKYLQLLESMKNQKDPSLELFSDPFKWRVKPYPKLLGFASPIPVLKRRIQSLAA